MSVILCLCMLRGNLYVMFPKSVVTSFHQLHLIHSLHISSTLQILHNLPMTISSSMNNGSSVALSIQNHIILTFIKPILYDDIQFQLPFCPPTSSPPLNYLYHNHSIPNIHQIKSFYTLHLTSFSFEIDSSLFESILLSSKSVKGEIQKIKWTLSEPFHK